MRRGLSAGTGATVVWVPFDLHPEYPPEGIPREDLEAHYGGGFHARVKSLIEQVGFTYDQPEVVPNSNVEQSEVYRKAVLQPACSCNRVRSPGRSAL